MRRQRWWWCTNARLTPQKVFASLVGVKWGPTWGQMHHPNTCTTTKFYTCLVGHFWLTPVRFIGFSQLQWHPLLYPTHTTTKPPRHRPCSSIDTNQTSRWQRLVVDRPHCGALIPCKARLHIAQADGPRCHNAGTSTAPELRFDRWFMEASTPPPAAGAVALHPPRQNHPTVYPRILGRDAIRGLPLHHQET